MNPPILFSDDWTEQSAKLDQIIWVNLEDIGYGK